MARSNAPPRTWSRDGFFISTDTSLIPTDAVNKAFAFDDLYWATPLPESAMREMLDSSMSFGLYSPTSIPPPNAGQEQDGDGVFDPAETLHEIAGHVKPKSGSVSSSAPDHPQQQSQQAKDQDQPSLIGFARCITDGVTLAYLTDVYILPEWKGQGLGKWLVSCVQEVLEDMPHLRRSLALTTRGNDQATGFYNTLMKMSPLQENALMLSWKGPGNSF